MKYRIAEEKDFIYIMSLILEIYENLENKDYFAVRSYDIDKMRTLYENNGFFVICEDDNKIVGYISVVIDIKNKDLLFTTRLENEVAAEISQIGVLKEYRKRGIANNLVNLCIEELKRRNKDIKFVFGTVHPENIGSMSTFLKNNFYVYKTVDIYNGLERNIIIKDL